MSLDIQEDELLSELVKDYMENDRPPWSKISKELPGRIGKQCRERFLTFFFLFTFGL